MFDFGDAEIHVEKMTCIAIENFRKRLISRTIG